MTPQHTRSKHITFTCRLIVATATALFFVWCVLPSRAESITFGTTARIVTAPNPSPADAFAASELASYLEQISGTSYAITSSPSTHHPDLLIGARMAGTTLPADLGEDGFVLKTNGQHIIIAGKSDRGTLYGVYAFLERLGCRWFAPNFNFYGSAKGEFVPHRSSIAVDTLNIIERPAFQWRKLYIEEGQSHAAENLLKLVDWMAKARMNVLDCPNNYQGAGRTKWDNWRDTLIPELRKRGLLIEVGGHGYQNYLPQEQYFSQHPEWFGLRNGVRSNATQDVFATSNPDAVRTFIANIASYLHAHPEIDIFDLWPPDGAQWSEAKDDVALGTPTERQMLLLSHVAAELQHDFPHVRLQFIAYQNYIAPPSEHKPDKSILMEFCPIDRSFESALYEGASSQNEEYFHDLQGWSENVMAPASITVYSYITKYAWRSLPITIPHLIVDELRRFHEMGIGGLATYSEPGSWATFELEHYITAHALWNPYLDVTQGLSDYIDHRYGAAALYVAKYLRLVEEVVPHAVNIPGTTIDPIKQQAMLDRFQPAEQLIKKAHEAAENDASTSTLIDKLDHQYRYVSNEMKIQYALSNAQNKRPTKQYSSLTDLLQERDNIYKQDLEDGVILHDLRSSATSHK